jgi:hypothetical protein
VELLSLLIAKRSSKTSSLCFVASQSNEGSLVRVSFGSNMSAAFSNDVEAVLADEARHCSYPFHFPEISFMTQF